MTTAARNAWFEMIACKDVGETRDAIGFSAAVQPYAADTIACITNSPAVAIFGHPA